MAAHNYDDMLHVAREFRDRLDGFSGVDDVPELRRVAKMIGTALRRRADGFDTRNWTDARGFPRSDAPAFQAADLPLIALELGWRRASLAARPESPSVSEVIAAAQKTFAALTEARALARAVTRAATRPRLELSEIPTPGEVIEFEGRDFMFIEAMPYVRKSDGADSFLLRWQGDDGQVWVSGLRGDLHAERR